MATESAGIWSSLGRSAYGKRLQRGFLFDVGVSRGLTPRQVGRKMAGGRIADPAGRYSFLGGRSHWRGATRSAGAFGKAAGGTALRALPIAFMGHAIYTGYKEGGAVGAVKGGAEMAAYTAAFETGIHAFKAIGGLAAIETVGVAAALGYGTYAFGEAAQKHMKGLKKVEMGAEVVDRFGSISTLRQRSMSALQNSHINGRMAIGNEAILTHASFR